MRGVNCEREGFVERVVGEGAKREKKPAGAELVGKRGFVRRVPLTGAKSEAFCFVLGGAVSLDS